MYNAEKYIANCLDSLLNQDLSKDDYEILVMDDGSVDGCNGIVKSYAKAHKNIFLYSEKNSGPYYTRNKLLKLAKGNYVYNLDADDYIVCNSLNTLLSFAFSNDVDVLSFNSKSTTDLNLFSSQSENTFTNLDICTGIDFFSRHKFNKVAIWWFIIKHDFIIDNDINFEPGNGMADAPFTFKLFISAKKVMHLPMDVHRYVQVSTSIMHNSNQSHLKKMINDHVDLIYRFNSIIVEVSKKNDHRFLKVVSTIKYWADVNVYLMFYKFIKTKITPKNINEILHGLEEVNIYPMTSFVGDKCFSTSHKLITWFFNHKYLFFVSLYPLRFLVKLKLIKLPM
jgi:glycosyltransferase involved in cell wall biosynthesis